MKLTQQFAVDAEIDEVWRTILDVESVAGCVPGARVVGRIGDDAYKVAMTIKLGPVSMEYRGEIQVLEADESARRAVMRGRAKEARGQGTAEATAELHLRQEGGTVHGEVTADVKLSGRAAAMGQGVIGDVAEQMIGQFSTCLQTRLAGAEPALAGVGSGEAVTARARSGDDGGMGARTVGGAAVQPEAAASGGAQSAPGARAADRMSAGQAMPATAQPVAPADVGEEPEAALDAFALARTVIAGRLREPAGMAVLLVAGVLVVYLLGRRAGSRRTGLSIDDALRLAEELDARRS
jgi:uncharacterized protein